MRRIRGRSGPGVAACVPARECLGREPSSSSCVRVPCSGVGVAVSGNTLHVGGGRSRRRKGLGIASHCGAVRSLHSVTVRGITFRQLASQHTTPSHVWHHSFCFSAVRRIGVRAGQSPHGSHFPQVFRLVCLAGAPVSMEMKCSVSSPVEMPLPMLRLSWANMQLVGSFVRPSFSVVRKAFGAHS